jgi:putative endonuclease
MFYLYILQSNKDEKLYIGYTGNLRKRMKEHNEGKNFSTKPRIPFKLVYYESYTASEDAKGREQQLKKYASAYTHLKKRINRSLPVCVRRTGRRVGNSM